METKQQQEGFVNSSQNPEMIESETMERLNNLVGLENIKQTLGELAQKVKVMRYMQVHRGEVNVTLSPNLTFVFMGNPGTGKTMVAHLMGKILYECGLLSSAEVITYSPDQIVSKYVGGTTENVNEMFKASFGRVLFIDEAYALASNQEAIDQIVVNMTNPEYKGKLAVVIAGYTQGMSDLLNNNPGLNSRFVHKVMFEDYTSEELWQILKSLASHHQPEPLVIDDECHPHAIDYFDSLSREQFGNAWEAAALLQSIEDNMKLRAYQQHITDSTIRPEDFPNYESKQAEPEQGEEIPFPHEGGFTRYLKEHAVYEEKATADPLERIYNLLENLQVNMVLLVQNQSSAADVAAMRRENEAYKSDANMKLMRAYGVDAMIRIYQAVSERLFRLHHPAGETHPTDEGEEKALLWVQKRMAPQFKKLGIRLQTSEIGTEFNGDTMVMYGDNGEDVDESETMFPASAEHPDGTIKESVSPAFIWTIPSLNNMSREWCMEPEKVCIYVD